MNEDDPTSAPERIDLNGELRDIITALSAASLIYDSLTDDLPPETAGERAIWREDQYREIKRQERASIDSVYWPDGLVHGFKKLSPAQQTNSRKHLLGIYHSIEAARIVNTFPPEDCLLLRARFMQLHLDGILVAVINEAIVKPPNPLPDLQI